MKRRDISISLLGYDMNPRSVELPLCIIMFCVVEKFHMSFRMGKTECKLVKSILVAHGFREVSEFYRSVFQL